MPGDVGIAGGVHGDAEALVVAAPTDVAAVDEPGAVGVDLGHECVIGAAVGQVGPTLTGKVLSSESVMPVTYALPAASTAMPWPTSSPAPPM